MSDSKIPNLRSESTLLVGCIKKLREELGHVLTAKQLACYLGVDERTVRQYYRELGGVRLGRRYLFFEKGVIDAIQKRTKMGGPSEETGYE
ncbi:MAG: hypothetical protein DRG83_13835, partial [Deltaproteobacteria bacterium]